MKAACHLCATLLLASLALAQAAQPRASSGDDSRKTAGAAGSLFPEPKLEGKVSLVRGVLIRLDPIHDQLQVRAFGGSDLHIGFDDQTKVFVTTPASTTEKRLRGIPAGTVVSVDTVTEDGKMFARSVRIGAPGAAELNGRVVRYDPTRSQLILRDPISPEEITIRMDSGTTVVRHSQPATVQALAAGMLVSVQYSAAQNAARKVEILAEPGSLFTFSGRVLAVDLRSRVVTLSNDSDRSMRELALGSLDENSIKQLREGADVNITAVFDGDRYAVRSVTPVPQRP